ncbi:Coiled-coil domain-containing protein [Campylobacter sp. MIT 99-7217]|uniref:Coiled-coil domain-containing protein n=1 Tax=Campylobacter sp. MIT 99-7217 TaxID=535091 RepID=UPI00115B7385|nr:Coiled-coil domain-containing protein [Campylobacter sp. MIT 99-7217]TQR31796.1 Coiled-coil domain-containing protein [Campylobacter sp. MIT 99-7217]
MDIPNTPALSKEEQLQTLENEISQAEQSLESDFAKFASSQIDEKMEELFFENKEEFIKAILSMQNNFLQENYNALLQKRDNLKGQIAQEKQFADIEKAQQEFLAKHPDANMEELLALYYEELGTRYKKELDNLPPNEFFEALYQIQKQRSGGKEEENLPKDLNASSGDVSEAKFDYDDMPMNRI